jgi:N-carbamoyl-L-amino-acid hydrolase
MIQSIETINNAAHAHALAMLESIYGDSPWVVEKALASRPFKSLADLKFQLARVIQTATNEAQINLIQAHAYIGTISPILTADSDTDKSESNLKRFTPAEFAKIQQLITEYNVKFGFSIVLAEHGPRGVGMNNQQIIENLSRRLLGHSNFERQECLRNINRIAEAKVNEKFGYKPVLGDQVWDWHEELSAFSDPGFLEKGQLTVTYLTDAHRACAQCILAKMQDCGFDEVTIDAVGNVVGIYRASTPEAKTLMTGSHYDTVRNGGKYDGRLGIFTPMICVRELKRQGRRLPFHFEVVAFAEEEGQRFKATFLGSSAVIGDFKPEWLEQKDSDGVAMLQAMQHAGLRVSDIPTLNRNPADYLGFVEVHIEQGPVLNELNLPLGIVTSINGSIRLQCEIIGTASHAGTTPMNRRSDAVTALAELALYVEQRALADGDSVATIGMLQVPNGSVNVVPGRCAFSLDIRAPENVQRDDLANDILLNIHRICERRGLRYKADETMRAAAAPSAPVWQTQWEAAVSALGLPLHRMPSGAGHDAMKLHEVMPQAMLFVRGQNSGISHNPLESSTNDDMQLLVEAFHYLLTNLAVNEFCKPTLIS